MAAWLERAPGPAGPSLAAVYVELGLAFILLATILHFRRSRGTSGELRAVRRYFLLFAALVLAAPVALVLLTASHPFAFLASAGWTFGRSGLGAVMTLAGLPLTVQAGRVGSRDPAMQRMYPFAKAVCASTASFVSYEIAYFGLYYVPWESAFRGILFLPLVPVIGLVPALAVQTAVSTLLHFGHPRTEIAAAAGAGIAFGLLAYFTGSFLYPLILHASTGISTDTFLFLRRRSGRPL
jgi:membrane protease YdiL (CAAX protease family)